MSIVKIWPPSEGCSTWDIIGDLRFSDVNYDNHDLGGAVATEARDEGLEFEADHESSCSYFYAADEATAKAIADICDRLTVVSIITFKDPS